MICNIYKKTIKIKSDRMKVIKQNVIILLLIDHLIFKIFFFFAIKKKKKERNRFELKANNKYSS